MRPVRRSHSGTGLNTDYSLLRQYAAEVPILAKFLLMPHAAHPAEADLFVVPFFGSTELFVKSKNWNRRNLRARDRVHALEPQLTYLRTAPRRHIFFATRDPEFCIPALRDLVNRTGAMLLHYGPRHPTIPSEIVVPANAAGFGAPITPLAPVKHFLFAMMSTGINRIRSRVARELRVLGPLRAGVEFHVIGNHNSGFKSSGGLSPQQAFTMMQETLLCPIVQGDLPYQHRLYDTIVAGCVPFFLKYDARRPDYDETTAGPFPPAAAIGKYRPCEAWSWDPTTVSSYFHGMNRENEHSCVETTLPFPATVACAEQVKEARRHLGLASTSRESLPNALAVWRPRPLDTLISIPAGGAILACGSARRCCRSRRRTQVGSLTPSTRLTVRSSSAREMRWKVCAKSSSTIGLARRSTRSRRCSLRSVHSWRGSRKARSKNLSSREDHPKKIRAAVRTVLDQRCDASAAAANRRARRCGPGI